MFGIPWHRLPTLLALLKLSGFRKELRQKNLHDTSQLPDTDKLPEPQPSPDGRHLLARTADGSFNDLKQPQMGMVNTRLGRNVPLTEVKVDRQNLLNPNPREISQRLLGRDEFIPAESLNILAAAWIQFQNHDWFSHGDNQPDKKIVIPLAENDPWPQEHRPMAIKETLVDETRPQTETSAPPTFINKVTHWWDGSQIYGSHPEQVDQLRSHIDGKLIIGDDGLLPVDANGIDRTGFNDNWWIGLSLLHTLFVREHNTICDRLKQQYPDWKDDDLFDHARLINAALMAKIHTVEWTPGILAHPALQIAMNANWWGLLGQNIKRIFGRIGDGETISGIIGSPTDHHTAPYYITEEFVSVYRLHPLIPDEFEFYSHGNGKLLRKGDFFEVAGKRARGVVEEIGLADLFYSLGIAHPGAITLHNYPKALQKLIRDNGEVLDLAAIDILRDRERGVPRYNDFREIIGRGRIKSFEEITSNQTWVKELREVYNNDINSVDLMVGMFAEDLPKGFGFSDTAFRVFILMASRRLKSDRFFTKDYRAEVYTQFGLDWIDNNGMLTVLQRHLPSLDRSLSGVKNAFAPWNPV
ncbi:peroxidase [Calothrix sp. FACHB-1219]|uniref:peroxidase family protein n=1 Tax=unclassified Calothrix TaxID=2619626 RepID=UPI001682036F|nr:MULTISPECIES: peroxidase family protein [unclassified Calothrix]MBD2201077.1 peroxidase [Calothrix sp. FACHB-168]MBD2215510.1 peroxidase [Calothrix sp. FACHB-1219]